MNNNLNKANKIVDKATGVFDQAAQQVEKANELLRSGMEDDAASILKFEDEIESIKLKIVLAKEEYAEKAEKLSSNVDLINDLSRFTNRK